MSSNGWIQTRSGLKFDPLNPDPASICVEDIAHALSNLCRFTGHASRFYSVAEHSVRVSRRVFSLTGDPTLSLWGLLHDASEAYICDIARPLKQQPEMHAYRDAEANLQAAIARAFELDEAEPEAVRRADLELLGLEATELMQPMHPEWHATAPAGAFPVAPELERDADDLGWLPDRAKRTFLHRYYMLLTVRTQRPARRAPASAGREVAMSGVSNQVGVRELAAWEIAELRALADRSGADGERLNVLLDAYESNAVTEHAVRGLKARVDEELASFEDELDLLRTDLGEKVRSIEEARSEPPNADERDYWLRALSREITKTMERVQELKEAVESAREDLEE